LIPKGFILRAKYLVRGRQLFLALSMPPQGSTGSLISLFRRAVHVQADPAGPGFDGAGDDRAILL
jgi:hypothetical protein